MAGAEIDQRRRNVRCLELLDSSYQARLGGDMAKSRRLIAEARKVAPDTFDALTDGMMIGAVPRPDVEPDDWAECVQANRDGLEVQSR